MQPPLSIWLLASGQAKPANTTAIRVKSSPLCHIPADRTPNFRLITNADMTQIAAIDTWDTGKWYVSLNGVVWEFYTAVDASSAQFSSDGKHFSLLAQHDNAWFLITDDHDARALGPGACYGLVLSRDSQHDACVQATAGGFGVLSDGKPLAVEGWPSFDAIAGPLMTPEGGIAFVGRRGQKAVMVLDGKPLGTFPADRLSPLALSPDGMQLICAALVSGAQRTITQIVNGQPQKHWPIAGTASLIALELSPDGQRVAWAQSDAGGTKVVVDGAPPQDARIPVIEQLLFSPDGKHIAWKGTGGPMPDCRYLVIDGEQFVLDASVTTEPLEFSPDSRNLHCLSQSRRCDCCLQSDRWSTSLSMVSPDGELLIFGGATWVNAQDKHGEPAISERSSLLDARMADSHSAYVLTESPRAVQVNGKKINLVTRYELTWPPAPPPLPAAAPAK